MVLLWWTMAALPGVAVVAMALRGVAVVAMVLHCLVLMV